MKIRIFHYFLIISLLLVFLYHIPAEFIYIGNFEDEINDVSPSGWIPYTDDDIRENGWIVKGGKIVQTIINGDQTQGGARILFKDNILDFTKANRSTTTSLYLDVYPLDYKEGSGDVWFGMGFLADFSNPMSDSIIVALRKNNEENKSGLHIFAGKNGWISQKNNFDFQIMKWHRIKVYVENRISKNTFLLKAKAWLISNPEPEEWLAAEEIPYRAIDLSSKGVFIGTYATLGNKKLKGKIRGNPRCAFDNFIIYRGDVSAIQYNLYSSSEKEIEPILELSDDQAAMELYEFAYKIGPPNSNYAGFDRLMFIEMLFLREIHQWGESCLRANQLMSFFPESPYAARMGGKDGRTEDKAAIEFADATTPMQAGEYKKSHNLFKQFLENYPNNWRHDIAQYRMVFSLYWMAANDDTLHFDVINAMNAVIDENPDSIYLDDIYSLLIGTNIRIGNKQEARKLLDFAMKTFSHPQKQQEYEHLWMDTYLFPSVVDKKELENATQLIDICSERAIKYYEDANDKRAAKYISYLISYYEIVDGEDKLEENLRDFKDKAMKRSKEMHDFIEYTEASYYWHKDREKGIKAYQDLLDSNPEPEIRKECIQKILEFMASKGKDFAELKAFKEKHEKEEQK